MFRSFLCLGVISHTLWQLLPACQEQCLREWYNIGLTQQLESAVGRTQDEAPDNQVLFASDDEEFIVMYESDGSAGECGDGCSDNDGGPQDVLVESPADEVEAAPPQKKRRYTNRAPSGLKILGKSVCTQAHKRLYAIGSGCLQNLRKEMPAFTMHDRMPEPKHQTLGKCLKRRTDNYKWPDILLFFFQLYVSAAEILPSRFVMPDELFRAGRVKPSEDCDFEDRYVHNFMRNLDRQFDLMQLGQIGPGSFQGPRRYLEWSRPIDLYCQYVGICEAEDKVPAALSTFMRVFKSVMGAHLKFRGKTEHAQCGVCWHRRQRIKNASSGATKKEATRNYSRHLLSQWLDRQNYWNARSLSRSFFSNKEVIGETWESSLLTCIIDGMDQSKLRLPKFGWARVSKSIELLFRPTTHLTGCWLHGYQLFLSLADENLKKDSETQCEIIMRALSHLKDNCGSMPCAFHLQSDNCFRETKNRFVFTLNLMLVALGAFRYTVMSFLRTAHSHEDIDQCFGQISKLFAGKQFDAPEDMIDLLNQCVASKERSCRSKLSSGKAYKLDQVSLWKEFVRQTGIYISGMRRVHYLRICLRKDVGHETLGRVREVEDFRYGGRQPHPEDLFLVTKRWMHDTSIERVIALMPASLASELRRSFSAPHGLAPRRAIGAKVKQNIETRVPRCRRAGELSEKAAKYLLNWNDGSLRQCPKPQSYSILRHRCNPAHRGEERLARPWVAPSRYSRSDVYLPKLAEGDELSGTDDDDDAPVDFPAVDS